MTVRVSNDDLETAIAWLDVNNGRDGEQEACQRVMVLLRAELASRVREAAVRQLVKETGRSAADVRKAMKAKGL